MKTRSVLAALFILVSGCGGPGPAMEAGRPVAPRGLDDSVLVPPGYGTLTQTKIINVIKKLDTENELEEKIKKMEECNNLVGKTLNKLAREEAL